MVRSLTKPFSALKNATRYRYEGPVLDEVSKHCIKDNFKSETSAMSKKQAISNIGWQYKKAYRLAKIIKLSLPGELTII